MTTEVERKPAIDLAVVQEFVAKSHGDLPRVEELLTEEPNLVNAAHDWGGGDWETGLGAAAHMGRRDIASVLLDHGARIDIFAAAMLGHIDLVKALLNQYPHMRHSPGPHGIPLEAHAAAGGADAAGVLSYLQELSE